jgi:hypothetical protein
MSAACSHPPEKLKASTSIWFIGLVKDWRYWALAFGTSAAVGVATGPLGLGGWANALFALYGLYPVMMLSRFRECSACGERLRFALLEPPPSAPGAPTG